MKPVNFLLLLLSFAIGIVGCSKCDNENPRSRIVNNGTDKASVQIKTSGGNTENINNIQPGQSSEWRSFAEGTIEFTVAIQGQADQVLNVAMATCWEYAITIDSNNVVSSIPTERN